MHGFAQLWRNASFWFSASACNFSNSKCAVVILKNALREESFRWRTLWHIQCRKQR